MKLLELPIDVFRYIIEVTVQELPIWCSIKARLVCHIFADEILDAVIKTKAIETIVPYTNVMYLYDHYDLAARYIHHRLRTDGVETHPWITTMRQTIRMLVDLNGLDQEPARMEILEWSVCFCLAAQRGGTITLDCLAGDHIDDLSKCEGGLPENCLTIAAWVGDLELAKPLTVELDCASFFGRPIWAAAAQGHLSIVKHFLQCGVPAYELDCHRSSRRICSHIAHSPLCAAAYMARQSIVRFLLEPRYPEFEMQHEERAAIKRAAEGDHPEILKLLLEHYKAKVSTHEFTVAVDDALVRSCDVGSCQAARLLLQYGANPNVTDLEPRSCLQLAAIVGISPLVKMLLDAGASLEAAKWIRHPYSRRVEEGKPERDALGEARRRGHAKVVKLLEDKLAEQGKA